MLEAKASHLSRLNGFWNQNPFKYPIISVNLLAVIGPNFLSFSRFLLYFKRKYHKWPEYLPFEILLTFNKRILIIAVVKLIVKIFGGGGALPNLSSSSLLSLSSL